MWTINCYFNIIFAWFKLSILIKWCSKSSNFKLYTIIHTRHSPLILNLYDITTHKKVCWMNVSVCLLFSSAVSCSFGRPTMHCSWSAVCSKCSSERWARGSCTSSSPTRRGRQTPQEVSAVKSHVSGPNNLKITHRPIIIDAIEMYLLSLFISFLWD